MKIEEIIEPKKKKWDLSTDLIYKFEDMRKRMTPFKWFIYSSIFFFFFIMILELSFGESHGGGHAPVRPNHTEVKFKDIPSRLDRYALISLIIGAMMAYISYFTKKRDDENPDNGLIDIVKEKKVICNNCIKMKKDDGIYNCECGGLFVTADKLDWAEKDKQPE